jgi:hypothetical protein
MIKCWVVNKVNIYQLSIGMPCRIFGPSGIHIFVKDESKLLIDRGIGSHYLDNFPSGSKLVVEVFFDSSDHGRIHALLDAVLRTNDDLACFGIAEQEDFLCDECDHKDRNVVFKEFAGGDLEKRDEHEE